MVKVPPHHDAAASWQKTVDVIESKIGRTVESVEFHEALLGHEHDGIKVTFDDGSRVFIQTCKEI